jgi:hypothetical protein
VAALEPAMDVDLMMKKLFLSVILIVFCFVVVLVTTIQIFSSEHGNLIMSQRRMTKPSFLYLLQTESCLPDHLKSYEAIGDATSCQCDVLVLSFERACDESLPAHVKYISSVNFPTTWNTGRNLLLEGAMKRSENYLYYIFMDDDIDLEAKEQDYDKKPWREFEHFLRLVEPAVGAAESDKNQWVPRTYEARKAYECGLDVIPEYIPTVYYDGAFNAFHYNAVEHILPYPSKYDHISWWFSQRYIIVKSKVLFPGQSVTHTGILAMNPKHRQYPRKDPDPHQFMDILSMVQADVPKWYQNSSLLVEWKVCGSNRETESRLITCLPLAPPRTPIKIHN